MTYIYYNLTNITNAGNETTVMTLISAVNNQMNYIPGTLILLAIYIILIIALIGKGVGPHRALAATSWVCMILAFIAYPLGLITGTTLIIYSILVPITMVILFIMG